MTAPALRPPAQLPAAQLPAARWSAARWSAARWSAAQGPCRVLAAALVLSHATPASAGGYEIAQQGARAGGTASAATAREADPSAAWFNPAALADGRGLRTGIGVTLALPTLHAEALPEAPDAPWQADTDAAVSPPPQLYASYAHERWVFGVSANLPYASRVQWPADWQHRFDVISSQIQFVRIAPLVGYDFGPLRLAAGPQFDIGRVHLKRATDHIDYEGSSAIVMSGHGFGGHVSLFARPWEQLAVGVSYRSRSVSSLTGDADFNVPEVLAGMLPDQRVATEWTLPDRIAVGAAGRFGPVEALLDLSMTLWSVNDSLLIVFEDPATDNRESPRGWRDSLALRMGLEWNALQQLDVRAGFYVDGLPDPPPPPEHLSPSSPDSTRVAGTLGLGANVADWLSGDVFYEHMRLLERTSSSDDAPAAAYSGYAHFFGIGVRLHAQP